MSVYKFVLLCSLFQKLDTFSDNTLATEQLSAGAVHALLIDGGRESAAAAAAVVHEQPANLPH